MKRSGFKKIDYKAALAKALEKRKRDEIKRTQQPVKRNTARLGAGRRMKEWARVWAFLKPRLEAAGRTRCEFDHLPHVCSGILTPAHSRKRREMVGDEIYEVAIACTNAHQILDERLSHEAMHVSVNYAIARAGGIITPQTEAAQKESRAA